MLRNAGQHSFECGPHGKNQPGRCCRRYRSRVGWQLIAQLVRAQGGVVVGIDLKPERVDLAGKLGADNALVGGPSTAEAVRSLTNGIGADCVIVAAAAKSSAPCRQALELCRDRGLIVVVGAVEMSFPWGEMYMKEIQLFMSRAYGPGSYDPLYEKKGQDYPLAYVRWTENRNMEEFLRIIASERIQLEPLITHRFALADATDAYKTILDASSNSLAVLLRYPAAETPEPAVKFQPRRRTEVVAENRDSTALRVALVGAGNLARWARLPNLRKIPDVTLQAVYSTNGARGKSYARRFGAAYCCSDYDEILRDPKIDVVLILSRNQHHASQTVAALRAGKHVFLESPWRLRKMNVALSTALSKRQESN